MSAKRPEPDDFVTLGFTDWLNSCPHGKLTKKNREFLRHCYDFVKREKCAFTSIVFKELGYSAPLFRQRVHKCINYIEIEQKGKPTWYKLKGIDMPYYQKPVTHEPTGVGSNPLHQYLEGLHGYALKIHDIAVRFHDPNLHRMLVERGREPHPENSSIQIQIPVSDLDVPVKAVIYPKTIQIHITNSRHPIIHDYYGILGLCVILGKISDHLSVTSGHYLLPDVKRWILYHYHLHIDKIRTKFSKKDVELEIEEFNDTMLRYYTKPMPNGTTVDRFEKIKTTKKTVKQEFAESLFSDDAKL